ncbi:MAG: 30S ribosomal protein S9 [Candidatus Pacebacteria bacterium]|nr:30S ribosomal protein S9 [Candidatus Paceibacterota bacterium]MDD5357163.1 30S ribosomal protein S9 [Candidatus Paceibacterota bacterium]
MTPTDTKEGRYIECVGRRKTAIARVRMTPSTKGSFTVNNKDLESYFGTNELRMSVMNPLTEAKLASKFKITAMVKGGGITGQAEALRHGVARALVEHDAELRKHMKKLGFLKRDPRAKERRKFGLKKARKSPQWSKR